MKSEWSDGKKLFGLPEDHKNIVLSPPFGCTGKQKCFLTILDRFIRDLFSGTIHKHPSRSDQYASNPFLTFRDIPVRARYEFLLDNFKYHVTSFIRGPVCKGGMAVNAINEHFWVFFMDPDSDLMVRRPVFEREVATDLILPARQGSDEVLLNAKDLFRTQRARNRYREKRNREYAREFPEGYSLKDIWNGRLDVDAGSAGQRLPALTVFRHYDSASVEVGSFGPLPRTIFILDYSLLERIYYALVAGFDVYGDIHHQTATRIYMGLLRMEAEELFLSFLPPGSRESLRNDWYRFEEKDIQNRAYRLFSIAVFKNQYPQPGLENPTSVSFKSESYQDQKGELVRMIKKKIVQSGMNFPVEDRMNSVKKNKVFPKKMSFGEIRTREEFEKAASRLTSRRAEVAPFVSFFPVNSFLLLRDNAGTPIALYSILRNKTHSNILWMLGEEVRRTPEDDILMLYPGATGSYPNMMFDVKLKKAGDFLKRITRITDVEDYAKLLLTYGRTEPTDVRSGGKVTNRVS